MPRHENFANLSIKDWSPDWTDEDVVNMIGALTSDQMAKLLSQKTESGDSVLHVAVKKKYVRTVEALLAGGAEVNAVGDMQQTSLHLAAYNNDARMVSLLLNAGARCNVSRYDEEMPIHIAVMMGAVEVVKMLIKHDVDQIHAVGRSGRTPFIAAAINDRVDVLDVLLENNADINQMNFTDHGAMHVAAIRGRSALIKFLVERGADINIISPGGMTPLQYVLTQRKPPLEILKLLISLGANVNAGKKSTSEILNRYHDPDSQIAEFLTASGMRADAQNSEANRHK